jgi:hypothetical protein
VVVVVEHVAGIGGRDGLPAFPGDAQDHGRDHETDDWVGEFETGGDDGGAGEDAEADEAVDAGVFAVGDKRRALEPPAGAQPNLGGDLVADEADHACRGEQPEVGEVDEPERNGGERVAELWIRSCEERDAEGA